MAKDKGTSRNLHTGDYLRTKPQNENFDKGWEAIWGKADKEKINKIIEEGEDNPELGD